ncbi:UNVERIFIED_CONTAM: hypothetical protein H355_003031 [Colinus virginianus]|nr:hypothetical protein H355_003031 [Colinus virginianus]
MLSMQQFPALPAEEERYRQVLSASRVLGTDEDSMGDGCSQKLASAKFLRLLLLILIPCICALILLLVILLTFVGVLEKTCFYSNGSEALTVNSDIEASSILLPNMVENGSKTDPTVDISTWTPSWTTTPLSQVGQMNTNSNMLRETLQENTFAPTSPASVLSPDLTNDDALAEGPKNSTQLFSTTQREPSWSTDLSFNITERMTTLPVLSPTHQHVSQKKEQKESVCINITNSQCQMLPYNYTTLTSVLSIVKSIEMEKFLKFFSYLSRLSCYQHIMLFGCSLALPECIIDGDDRLRWRRGEKQFIIVKNARENADKDVGLVKMPIFKVECYDKILYILCTFSLKISFFKKSLESTHGDFPGSIGVRQISWLESRTFILGATVCGGEESFLCASGICIPGKLQCNGYNDCDDWSDEVHCNCSDDLFHCNTGKCLNYTFVCDGYDDCGDLSDEQNCDCNLVTDHQCGDGRCITADWVCDGDHDCIDKSDEINCSCHSQGLVECKNGQCIPSAFKCDGDNDCKDGSDEENCSESKDIPHFTLPKPAFTVLQSQTLCQEGDQRCTSCPDPCGTTLCEMRNSQTNCSK